MFASSSVGQLSYSSSSMLYFEWILDSTVSHHMSPDSLSFAYVPLSFSIHVMIIDDTFMPIVGVDSVITLYLSLSNVYLISNLTLNLAFVG